ncbi:MAG: hypothetical protein CFH41_01341 [Alphaproteobacteria bacterium MarineAlpha11_Bin1]|nr:MAG: hypothetical protein CFH41_01341 [Alphaproteobacteria bacterium MarineAlpha11_Bin1]|tara:strand:+ start:11259 stop:11723 length:465 start_codon:yes stop_codon:yes gene_type:complete
MTKTENRKQEKEGSPFGAEGGPNVVDVHVGSRVRERRKILGLSQEKLGEALSLTFQQVQKYERGANRIGASRLYHISEILDVPIDYFFKDIPRSLSNRTEKVGPTDVRTECSHDSISDREVSELVQSYYKIKDALVRRRLLDLTKQLGESFYDP